MRRVRWRDDFFLLFLCDCMRWAQRICHLSLHIFLSLLRRKELKETNSLSYTHTHSKCDAFLGKCTRGECCLWGWMNAVCERSSWSLTASAATAAEAATVHPPPLVICDDISVMNLSFVVRNVSSLPTAECKLCAYIFCFFSFASKFTLLTWFTVEEERGREKSNVSKNRYLGKGKWVGCKNTGGKSLCLFFLSSLVFILRESSDSLNQLTEWFLSACSLNHSLARWEEREKVPFPVKKIQTTCS